MQVSLKKKRVGFHYYPDSLHYRQKDLNTFLPILNKLEVGWITLKSHPERAIPETFIQTLLENNITPIIHIPFPVQPINDVQNLNVLFQAYASWGIKYLVLFDRPNQQTAWNSHSWSKQDLVERFLDCFLPAAESLIQKGLTPVFPPLEPGGDYWDTVFLQSALRSIVRRGHKKVIESLVLSSYAWTFGHNLDWGKGGPEHWPNSFPYVTSLSNQDQRGFRIFDWYLSISQSVLNKKIPIILLAAGYQTGNNQVPELNPNTNRSNREQMNVDLYNFIKKSQDDTELIPPEVIACNIWLLAASENQPEQKDAWFLENKPSFRVLELLRQTQQDFPPSSQSPSLGLSSSNTKIITPSHYLLFPENSWVTRDWLYEMAQSLSEIPFVKFGASIPDAMQSRRVTVLGEERWLDESFFTALTSAGCVIEEIYGDGTLIATRINEFVNYNEVPK